MAESATQRSGSGTWDERSWEDLLDLIESDKVIPVVGPDLLQVVVDGQSIQLDRFVAARLAEKWGMQADAAPDESLNAFVLRYIEHGQKRARLYTSINAILKEAALSPPRPLVQLAEIEPFRLFVTTTFDTLLEDAINAARFGGQRRTESIAYAPNAVKDLEVPKARLDRPTVFHLLGRVSTTYSYVVSDEDLLEYVCTLQSETHRPNRLLDELLDNQLLLLGENFGDWLARLFLWILRTAPTRKLSDTRNLAEVVADTNTSRDQNLVLFLRHFSGDTVVYPGGGAVEFVDQLWRRWRARHPVNPDAPARVQRIPPPSEMPPRAVFISYSRRDLDAVYALKEGLEAAGLTVWFDLEQLPDAQANWKRTILRNVKSCSIFVPVISAHTEAEIESGFRLEWSAAVERAQFIDDTRPFIVPVIVDDTRKPRALPERFLKDQLHWVPGGQVTTDFARRVQRFVAQATSPTESGAPE
jgi:hypothetical protein